MKHVTFVRAMPPHSVGDRRLVPDEIAARLAAEGAIQLNPPDWPADAPAKPAKPAHRRRYLTK